MNIKQTKQYKHLHLDINLHQPFPDFKSCSCCELFEAVITVPAWALSTHLHLFTGEFDFNDLNPNHGVSSHSTCLTLGTCFHGRKMMITMMITMTMIVAVVVMMIPMMATTMFYSWVYLHVNLIKSTSIIHCQDISLFTGELISFSSSLLYFPLYTWVTWSIYGNSDMS